MRRLCRVTIPLALVALLASVAAAAVASAQQRQRPEARPPPRPPVILRDRSFYGPPPPPSSDRNFYGPAPSIQPPAQRVPSVPPLALAIYQFLWVWNDLRVALVFTGGTPDVAPITVRIAELAGTRGQTWHLLSAGAFIAMVVPVIVFLSLQRYFIRGMLAGSVKG